MIISKSSKQHASYVFLSAIINIASTSLFNIAPEPKIKTEPKSLFGRLKVREELDAPVKMMVMKEIITVLIMSCRLLLTTPDNICS